MQNYCHSSLVSAWTGRSFIKITKVVMHVYIACVDLMD